MRIPPARTATPYLNTPSYMEIPPSPALMPYVRCFWGSALPFEAGSFGSGEGKLVTPDLCTDIIFQVDYGANRISSSFCGLNDKAFLAGGVKGQRISTFAIRFYPWGAALFSKESMKGTRNGFFDADSHFPQLKTFMEALLFEKPRLRERAALAESFLLENLRERRKIPALWNALDGMLRRKGNVRIEELAGEVLLGSRQLERIFQEYIGLSPKKLSSLFRYQFLWEEILENPYFQILDGVYQYGYTDQAHLLHEFKGYHTMNPLKAREYAFAHVGFLQERKGEIG